MPVKPNKIVIQQPLTLNGKFVRYKIVGDMTFLDVNVGDDVLLEKRPALDRSLDRIRKAKVAKVYISTFDRASIVELEAKDFKDDKALARY
jgi:hypothetical protein